MHHRSISVFEHRLDALTLAAATWLACGLVLYGLTPLPLHTDGWGWTLAFWALAAPAAVLLGRHLFNPSVAATAPMRKHARLIRTTLPARRVQRPSRTPPQATTGDQTLTPLRLASIRRSNSRMMR